MKSFRPQPDAAVDQEEANTSAHLRQDQRLPALTREVCLFSNREITRVLDTLSVPINFVHLGPERALATAPHSKILVVS